MSAGPSEARWQAIDGGHRIRRESLEKCTQWVVLHHRGARAHGTAAWRTYVVCEAVVAYAWPVAGSTDWWLTMRPMSMAGW